MMKNLIKLEPTGYVAVAKWFALEAGRCGWSRPDVWAWAGLGIVRSVTTEAALGIHPSAKTAFPQITKSVCKVQRDWLQSSENGSPNNVAFSVSCPLERLRCNSVSTGQKL